MSRSVNQGTLELVKSAEGLSLTAYRCPAGVLTIGWGHTGGDVTEGKTITMDIAETLLQQDLDDAGDHVLKEVTVPLNDNEYGALCSLTFNIGAANFAGSTVLKDLNAQDRAGAAAAFNLWVKATVNGQKVTLPGLVKRRAAEAALFLEPADGFGPMPQAVTT
jgi:lysozyme